MARQIVARGRKELPSLTGHPKEATITSVRPPGQKLVVQREVRLRGPGASAEREIRASEEEIC
eukprot:15477484-Alexandrium_andersonii.AAC.1